MSAPLRRRERGERCVGAKAAAETQGDVPDTFPVFNTWQAAVCAAPTHWTVGEVQIKRDFIIGA